MTDDVLTHSLLCAWVSVHVGVGGDAGDGDQWQQHSPSLWHRSGEPGQSGLYASPLS